MHIPRLLQTKLGQNTALQGAVLTAVGKFETWLRPNQLVFFPEYTDHSIKHIEEVLATEESLIITAARTNVTASDAAVIVLATLLHDSAMHLSVDGFKTLIASEVDHAVLAGLHNKPWLDLWNDFLAEASRFDERKLRALFGSTEPVNRKHIEQRLEKNNLEERDRYLVGEFLRRHHPRLAHEIALLGVPGPSGRWKPMDQVPADLADLSGLVARSHGMSIRSTFAYLSKYDRREYQGVHTVFLMTLLRVADYLQIQEQRAPRDLLETRTLRSPISQGEWKVHASVRNITRANNDPEAIHILAEPPDVRTYLRVREWLAGIQAELDASWAVLGEIYGSQHHTKLNRLGLSLRRVTSNLDDEAAFSSTVDYVPLRCGLTTANADLLKLLIGPLYGDTPEIGIRELLQNAVDAVRERELLEQQHGEIADKLRVQAADVVISLDTQVVEGEEKHYVTVSDRGVGMTVDAVRNYFLKAGATFRNSDAWKRVFTDEQGHSQVLRSGRFGVGVLAAFLVGPEVEVATRHALADEGLHFSVRMDSDLVEVRKLSQPVGTTIRVSCSAEVYERLIRTYRPHSDDDYRRGREEYTHWDWYCLREPKVERIVPAHQTFPQGTTVPSQGAELPAVWHRIEPSGFDEVHWTHAPAPGLVCNGIRVGNPHEPTVSGSSGRHIWSGTLRFPNLSVFDPDGTLPLNLQRNGLVDYYPFAEELEADVTKDFIAWLLTNAPSEDILRDSAVRGYNTAGYAFNKRWEHLCQLFATDKGVSLVHEWHVQSTPGAAIIVIPRIGGRIISRSLVPRPTNVVLAASRTRQEPRDIVTWVADSMRTDVRLFRWRVDARLTRSETAFLDYTGKRVLVDARLVKDLLHPINEVMATHEIERESSEWVVFRLGVCPDSSELLDLVDAGLPATDEAFAMQELYPAPQQTPFVTTQFVRTWEELLGSPVIPFETRERRLRFAKAYEELAPYIQAHETLRQQREAG